MSTADGIVLPKPQIPKTLGILNIIFGVLLVLFGMCTIGFTLAGPMLGTFATQAANQANQASTARHQANLKALEDEEKAATTEEAKAALKTQREELAANPPVNPVQPDLSSLDTFKNPTIRNSTLLDKGSGLLMSIASIVAGVGLVRMKEWGRSLGAKLSLLQLVRLAVIMVGTMVFVMPVQRELNEQMVAKMEAGLKDGTTPANAAATVQMTKAMAPLTSVFVVGYWVMASIYPAISLWLLNTRGARAACRTGEVDPFAPIHGEA